MEVNVKKMSINYKDITEGKEVDDEEPWGTPEMTDEGMDLKSSVK